MKTRKLAALMTASLLMAGLIPLMMAPALAAAVDPEFIDGNLNCAAVTGLEELTRFEGNPVSSGTQNGVTITVNGLTFDWSSTVTIAAVFVKGGPGGNLYDYRSLGGATSDSGLHAPVNPSNGEFYGLSHITFCVPDDTTTTTEQDTTTTEQDTTTSTEQDTTTSTEQDTTTSTEQDTTTSTEQESTTTTEAEETTTTLAPEVEGETTTTLAPEVEGETTSTTEAEVEETTSTTEDDTDDTLPFTGIGTDGMAIAAFVALAAGAGLIFLTRGSVESEIDA